ncbi:MAG: CDP-diacylglycerol--serine O-phosphatidyltransferase [Bacteroidales bacterium]|nr:CDP-diacylglycerol--serine O-phosphatidyltransferase [Bacteroidales bacterium]
MKNLYRNIPNSITSLNLVSGCVAIVLAPTLPQAAFIAILIGAFFDFLDGLAARLLNAYSSIGKDLDSLADLVTFGIAPAMILFYRLHGLAIDMGNIHPVIPYLAFLLPVFSALRLAKFNHDARQTRNFIGLPTPANALFWGAMSSMTISDELLQPFFLVLIFLIPVFSWLMVSNIPMFSMKAKSLAWKGNEQRYPFIVAALFLCVFFTLGGVVLSVALYIILSVFTQKKTGRS